MTKDEIFDAILGKEGWYVNPPDDRGMATKMLQHVLNVFNLRGKMYPDIYVDGRIGPRTINTLRSYLRNRGKEGARYVDCSKLCAGRALSRTGGKEGG